MSFNYDEETVRRSQEGMQRAVRAGLTVIVLLLGGLAAAELIVFAQDYLHALRG